MLYSNEVEILYFTTYISVYFYFYFATFCKENGYFYSDTFPLKPSLQNQIIFRKKKNHESDETNVGDCGRTQIASRFGESVVLAHVNALLTVTMETPMSVNHTGQS